MVKRLLVIGAALASWAVSSPASAATDATTSAADSYPAGVISIHTNGVLQGTASMQSYGEIFTACDKLADGYGVSVNWYVVSNPSNHGSAYDSNGANNGCATDNADIAEGRTVAFRGCLRDNGAYIFCSDYFYQTA